MNALDTLLQLRRADYLNFLFLRKINRRKKAEVKYTYIQSHKVPHSRLCGSIMSIVNYEDAYSICAAFSGESDYLVQIFMYVHNSYAKVNQIKPSSRAQFTKWFH